jgi:hypothetical protein
VARYYCPTARVTFSLLPDCLASRLSSTLAEVEQVVAHVEHAPTVEQAAAKLRPDITLKGALRWVGRRLHAVHRILLTIATLLGLGWAPTITAFREGLGQDCVLEALRGVAQAHLGSLPAPLGLLARAGPRVSRRGGPQQETGAPNPGDVS